MGSLFPIAECSNFSKDMTSIVGILLIQQFLLSLQLPGTEH